MVPRFELVAVGEADVDGVILDVRLLCDAEAPSRYFAFFLSTAHGPYASREDAEAFCAETFTALIWRGDLTPRDDERPCPVCGGPWWVSARHPRAICSVCVLEAADAQGRSLTFTNTSMSGGFEATREDGAKVATHECWVRGLPCWADEAHMGGIVVELEPGFGRRGGSTAKVGAAPLPSSSPYRRADDRSARSRFSPRVLVRATTTFRALLVWLALLVPVGFVMALASAFAHEGVGWTLSRWMVVMAILAAVLAARSRWPKRREPALLVAVVDESARTLTVTPIGDASVEDVRGGAYALARGDKLTVAWERDEDGGDGVASLVIRHDDGREPDVLWRIHPLQANVQIASIARFAAEVNGDIDALFASRVEHEDHGEQ